MKKNILLFVFVAFGTVSFAAATDNSAPHLELRHGDKQLIVGRQFKAAQFSSGIKIN